MNWTAVGAILLAFAVATGAFGAHALRGRLDDYSLAVYEKAVFYQFVHGLGILLMGVLARNSAFTSRAPWFLLAGVVFFSGSLYALALSGARILGAITPIGGLAFMIGWIWLAVEAIRARP